MPVNAHLYIINKSFKANLSIHFSAPYSYGEYVFLPVGLIIRIDKSFSAEDRVVSAIPAAYESWEDVFAFTEKENRAYSGFSLIINTEDLLACCELTDQPGNSPGQLVNMSAIEGCLIGTAIGDSIGLPYEGLSRQRVNRFIKTPLKHQLLFGFGMVSDDTEHTCLVAQALIQSAGESVEFKKQLAKRLKKWFLALPAGIGLATLKASIKLILGVSPEKSGVYSAGNGAMMRSAILGVFAGEQKDYVNKIVRINTLITHTDPKAELSAQMVAQAAYLNANQVDVNTENFHDYFHNLLDMDEDLNKLMSQVVESIEAGETIEDFCNKLGMDKGVSGYCYQTLLVVMHSYLNYPDDFKRAITSVVKCGGDTDTVAAILGGIIGSRVGIDGIPEEWLSTLKDWPCSIKHLKFIAKELAYSKLMQQSRFPADGFYLLILIRNIIFMFIVLFHGFRRLLPPY